MDRLILFIIFSVLLICCDDKKEFSTEFRIKNVSNEDIEFQSFFEGELNVQSIIVSNSSSESYGSGGPPIYDSAVLIKTLSLDSVIYRNQTFGDEITIGNHFFNADNWINEGNNKYFYTIRDEDFEN